jgi:CRISPR type III-A-associated RAMP protein Csm4
MKLEAIKLRFGNTPIHLGRGSDELDKTELIYHSDSMKSAIYSLGINKFNEWKNYDYFFHGFKLSSCFPYAQDEYFLPRPHIRKRILFDGLENDLIAKRAKKIEYLSANVFEAFLNTGLDDFIVHESQLTADLSFICEKTSTPIKKSKGTAQKISFFRTEVQQRVAVSATGSDEDPIPFYIDRIYFEEDCGFYFLASFSNENLREQVLTAMKLLGDHGIGTDRSVGNGLFDFDIDKDCTGFSFSFTGKANLQIPLGLFMPARNELKAIDLSKSAWKLFKRGGYMGGSNEDKFRHLRKKSIYMFGEGSVFSSGIELKGKYEDLKPDWNEPMHPAWRCGMPIILSI